MKRAQYKKSTANKKTLLKRDGQYLVLQRTTGQVYALCSRATYTKNLTPIKLLAGHLLPPAKDSNLLIER